MQQCLSEMYWLMVGLGIGRKPKGVIRCLRMPAKGLLHCPPGVSIQGSSSSCLTDCGVADMVAAHDSRVAENDGNKSQICKV